MIYSEFIELAKLPSNVGTPMQGKLILIDECYCAELTVFHSRFWKAVQAGAVIDVMVEIPLRRSIDANDFVRFRCHIYSVKQAQFMEDKDGLPVTVLSLQKAEGFYDICDPA